MVARGESGDTIPFLSDLAVKKTGNKAMQFVKLPDGSFVSPPGITATLTRSGNAYILKERFGRKMVFAKVSNKK